jgi:hypothetical protein
MEALDPAARIRLLGSDDFGLKTQLLSCEQVTALLWLFVSCLGCFVWCSRCGGRFHSWCS